ncbi:MAG TPA: hypothetical protein VM452_03700 [Caulifigura sp.]|jgi:hypothetical protein|nr:hypothetical protein [Caulifigura sp.]
MSIAKSVPQNNDWLSPTACEISDAVWTIHRSYELVCGLASDDARRELRRRQLQCPEDRRQEPRRKLCMPVDLIPVRIVDDRLIVISERVAAVTHDLSGQGIGLRHDRPLSTRFVAAEFDVFGEPVLILIDARWTRREDELSYLSGGRFVMVIDQSKLIPGQSLGEPDDSDASMNAVSDVS